MQTILNYPAPYEDATLIAEPNSTKNKDRARNPEMHSRQKGKQWYFGMKAYIGVDAHSSRVHTVRGTSCNVADITEGNSLLHGEEIEVFGDVGHQGVSKQATPKKNIAWSVAMRPGKRKKLDK